MNHATPSDAESTSRVGSAHTSRTALVLGGGGSTGNAWLIGVVAGLLDGGLDVVGADLTIGTSAGATATAQLAGAPATDLFAATTAAVIPPRTDAGGSGRGPVASPSASEHMQRVRDVIASSEDAADFRRRMGALALEADAASDGGATSRWRAIVAARLPARDWPERRIFLTAVDARTGESVVFDRHSGVDLVDAVAASTAGGGFAYQVGDRSYIDGGYRTNADNADLAAGCERVLVLAPLGGVWWTPPEWGTQLAKQVDDLRADGSRVETVFPDVDSQHLFGARAMDHSLRPAAARAGFDQGSALA
ncbi:MAG: patatin-like phospholipase family protein, partial [Mycetocola sp.]